MAGDEGEEKGVVLAIAGKEPCQTELGGGGHVSMSHSVTPTR